MMNQNGKHTAIPVENPSTGKAQAEVVIVIMSPEPVPGGRLPPWTALPIGTSGFSGFLETPADVPVILTGAVSSESSPGFTACSTQELAAMLKEKAGPKAIVFCFDGAMPKWPSLPLDRIRETVAAKRFLPLAVENDSRPHKYEEKVHLDENMAIIHVQRKYTDAAHLSDYGKSIGFACLNEDFQKGDCPRIVEEKIRAKSAPPPLIIEPENVLHIPRSLGEYMSLLDKLSADWRNNAGIDEYSERGQSVWVHPSAEVDAKALLYGPVLIGPEARVGRANILGPVIIGERAVVAHNSTVSRAVMLPGSKISEDCYVNQSVLGAGETLEENSTLVTQVYVNGKKLEDTARAYEGQRPMAFPHNTPFSRFRIRLYMATKRVIDIVGSLIGLGITLPFYPLIILAIKLSSPGPVFYIQRRQTRFGKSFPCIKFRTMRANAERQEESLKSRNECDGAQFYMDEDPRTTRFGGWMRRRNIDELPQLFNVLLGQMSLVGPRPLADRENQLCPAWRQARLSVRAGVTGLWQVCRRDRKKGDFHQWIYYDTEYVLNRSSWLDFQILWATMRLELMNFAEVGPDRTRRDKDLIVLPYNLQTSTPLIVWAGILFLAWAIIYRSTFSELWTIWNSDADYSHGPLIPLMAGGMIYMRRKDFRGMRIHPTWIGLILLGFAFFLRFFGLYYWYNSLYHISMVVALAGIVLTVYGMDIFRRALWPLAFLFMMVPLPGAIDNAITVPAQSIAASMATWFIDLVGIDVVQKGNTVLVEGHGLEVVRACSGLRLVYAFVALAWGVAYLSNRQTWEKIFIVLSSLPIAVFINGLRVFAIGAILSWADWKWSVESVHDAWAWLMMPLALGALLLELTILNRLFLETEERYEFNY